MSACDIWMNETHHTNPIRKMQTAPLMAPPAAERVVNEREMTITVTEITAPRKDSPRE